MDLDFLSIDGDSSTVLKLIFFGAAVVTTSFNRKISWLVDREHLRPRWELWGTIALCLVCALCGGVVGWRAWDPGLGAVTGAAGAGAAPFTMRLLEPALTRWAKFGQRNGNNAGKPAQGGSNAT